jgi:hypothetical protein
MRFNMGCGHNRLDGFINVDAAAECAPDQVWNLEQTPWPWPDDCAEEVRFIHSLEHMGATREDFLAIIKELYRIAAPGCVVEIHVPHPRHDDFINDPTHVRAITPAVLSLFDRALNDQWKASRAANSPLAHYTGVDFRITDVRNVVAEPYRRQLDDGSMTREQVVEAMSRWNNVITEFRIKLEVRKPGA